MNDRVTRAVERLGQLENSPQWQARMVYDLACYYALTAQTARAVVALKKALCMDPSLTDWSRQDTDLAPLWGEPAYEALYRS